jgi:hypothetical protein
MAEDSVGFNSGGRISHRLNTCPHGARYCAEREKLRRFI